VLGWIILVAFRPLMQVVPTVGIWLLVAGGVAYTGGLFFFGSKRRFAHSVWHLFVLAGSVLHYLCIAIYVMPMAY